MGFHQNPVESSAFVVVEDGRRKRPWVWGRWGGGGEGNLGGGVARCWKFCGINFAPSAKLSVGKFRHCPAACKFSHYVEGDDLRRRIPANFGSRGNVFAEGDVFSKRFFALIA